MLLESWIKASFVTGQIARDPLRAHLTYQVQAIGRLDVELRALDEEYGDLAAQTAKNEVDLRLSTYLDRSWFWVLAAYELVRTLDACTRAGLWTPTAELAAELKATKRSLARVRIPLAKFEPSGRAGKALPGDLIAHPALIEGVGAGWDVGTDRPDVVSRRDLSDGLLSLLESLGRP